MSTEAQIAANKANSQLSTGPNTPEGKAASSQNRLKHGFAGAFQLLPNEDSDAYQAMLTGFEAEHQPATMTEHVLVERMAQHQWLVQRALRFQTLCFDTFTTAENHHRAFTLHIRYQTTNERAFSKCLADLLKLRAERRKQQIGFESQQLKQAEATRRQSIEVRKQDLHKFNVWLGEAKAEHQELLNHRLETPEMRVPNRLERLKNRAQAA